MSRDVDWAAVHRDLADVYERHGLDVEAGVHRRLASSHDAAREAAEAKQVQKLRRDGAA